MGVAAILVLRADDDRRRDDLGEADLSAVVANLSQFARGVLVPDGDALFIYGGYTGADASEELPFFNSAVLIDPATGLGEELPAPPIGGALDPARTEGFRLGEKIYLVGGICDDLYPYNGDPNIEECPLDEAVMFEFDLASGVWSEHEAPPPLRESSEATIKFADASASGVPVAAIDSSSSLDSQAQFWRADQQVESWSQIPDPERRPLGYCISGDTLVVLQADFRLGDQILDDDPTLTEEGRGTQITGGETQGDGWIDAYVTTFSLTEPDQGWVDSASIDGWYESQLGFGRTLSCAEDRVIVGDGSGSFYQITLQGIQGGRWEPLPEAPQNIAMARPLATGDAIAFLPLQDLAGESPPAFVFDFGLAAWRAEPRLNTTGEVVAADGRVVGWALDETSGDPTGEWFVDVNIGEG